LKKSKEVVPPSGRVPRPNYIFFVRVPNKEDREEQERKSFAVFLWAKAYEKLEPSNTLCLVRTRQKTSRGTPYAYSPRGRTSWGGLQEYRRLGGRVGVSERDFPAQKKKKYTKALDGFHKTPDRKGKVSAKGEMVGIKAG